MYARYRTRNSFFHRAAKRTAAYGVRPNVLRGTGAIENAHRGVDESIDMSSKEQLDRLEQMRHPRERDFYQDHTYHNQWVERGHDKNQKAQLVRQYRYFGPNFEITPWVWYPGDLVEVVEGEAAGQRGTIIAVVKYRNEVLVQNINVKEIKIPASEDRPAQELQREHPIPVTRVRHVDPSTNALCDLKIVTVRNKESGALEQKRISLTSGVLLPIPAQEDSSVAAANVGDPLRDTPIQDAEELTYQPEKELPVLVARKLRAMEDYFVKELRASYEFHAPLSAANERAMRQFQVDALGLAVEKAAATLVTEGAAGGAGGGGKWWEAPIEELVAQMEMREAEEAASRQEAAAAAAAAKARDDDENVEEDDDDEDDEENDDDGDGEGEGGEGGDRGGR